MNKRGDIPTVLLFFAALVLAIAALYGFIQFSKGSGNLSSEMNGLLEGVYEREQFVIFQIETYGARAIRCSDCKQTGKERLVEVMNRERGREPVDFRSDFFSKLHDREFVFEQRDGIWIVSLDGVFVEMRDEKGSSIIRRFDIEIGFDANGKVVSEEVRFINGE
ncbi:MAG TPA: hypothetical protein VJK51_03630 [Candidatus Nanoarchaeia archaeon]|nr:hypothetical protein [Candidatus Nanoarchaeia archaeon]